MIITGARSVRNWPTANIDLLLRACLHPDRDHAAASWRAWTARRAFDDADWHEMRLLSALSTRIQAIDPDSPYAPRIMGLARNHWTRTQITLAASIEAMVALEQAGIPAIVFKGAALYAEGLAARTRRIAGDLDIVAAPGIMRAALDALLGSGWTSAVGESSDYLRAVADGRIGINLSKGRDGQVDLHRTPFHCHFPEAVAETHLWQAARDGQLFGHAVKVASPEASSIITLAHATASPAGDWAVDLAARIAAQPLDWTLLVDLSARWRVTQPVVLGLTYLRDELALAVPDAALSALRAMRPSPVDRLKHWSAIRHGGSQPILHQVVGQMVNGVLRAQGYELYVSDRRSIAIVRPRVRAETSAHGHDGEWATRHDAVPSGAAGRSLIVDLLIAVPRQTERVMFDVFADGVLVARLRRRVRGGGTGFRRLTARLHLPGGVAGRVAVNSVAVAASADSAASATARSFRLLGVRRTR